jgi:hypothetical protein
MSNSKKSFFKTTRPLVSEEAKELLKDHGSRKKLMETIHQVKSSGDSKILKVKNREYKIDMVSQIEK